MERQQPDKPFFLVVALPTPGPSQPGPSSEAYADREWPDWAKAYATAVSDLDTAVGTILDGLEQQGLAEQTVVFLTSDHARTTATAEQLAFFGSMGELRVVKNELYEGRLRVPLIARWPGEIEPGTVTDYPAAIWDLAPTLVSISGNRLPASARDGVSLVGAMRGEELAPRGMMYWEAREGGFGQAVRIGEWKAVRPRGKLQHQDVELYHLTEDPGEAKNVARENPDILATFIP